ncbi:MAG TPA: diaminopimelate epimerase [Acidimicrobiales bacterium]|nr:diaminopimelate epimerase [Acidimicrobiales bacterium]
MSRADALHLTKHHGAGNDFLVHLDTHGRGALSGEEVRALCDRHRGIGADGLIRGTPGASGSLRMELRNADGSPAEMSGNGIRCLVQAAVGAGMVGPGRTAVHTDAGARWVEYRPTDHAGLGYGRVGMGAAVLGARLEVEVPGLRWAQRVEMGNPHLVLFGEPAPDHLVRDLGPALERSVPGGANVEFVWPGADGHTLWLRVWERGVGETLACGTGACAVAAAAQAHGAAASPVRVVSPGGPLEVELGAHEAVLGGPVRRVGAVVVDEDALSSMAAAHPGGPAGDAASPGPPAAGAPPPVAARP